MTAAPTPLHWRRAPRRHQLALIAALVLVAIGIVLMVQYDLFKSSSSSNRVEGSGVAATETRNLGRFSSIELAGSNNVTVRVGGKQSVVVHADSNLLRLVTTKVQAGGLAIGNTSGTFTTKSPMHVEVTVPSLSAITLSGSGVISAAGIKEPSLTVRLSGAGVLRASGTATRLDVTLAGSGDAQLKQLAARDVQAVVSGSGRILVTATKSLDASVPGSGTIMYSGEPARVTTSITGSGAVARG
jgi:Putative auto-transporter adhesin, head GIN domain